MFQDAIEDTWPNRDPHGDTQAQASMTMQTLEDQVGGDPVEQFTPPRTGKSFTDQVMDRVADASNIDVFFS